ncbi:MAG: hypothetical protein NC350_00400 [Corallococcus sp.]|nr:hypothetical protein [Corallococcus sp.]
MTNKVNNAETAISEEQVAVIKKDRMRFKTNKLSSVLALCGLFINVLYFVCIYKSDVSTYYYNLNIGLSVLFNLIFMLAVFLSSEGVKNYKQGFAIALIVIGAFQIVRIFSLPMGAHNAEVIVNGETVRVMSDWQFTRTLIYLISSAALLIASGVIGIIRSKILENYKREIGEEQPA